MRAIVGSKATSRANKQELLFGIMKHISEKTDVTKHTELISAAKPWFDDAALAHFAKSEQAATWKKWLARNEKLASLLMAEEDVAAVLAVSDDDYSDVAPQLARLHASSRIGEAVAQYQRDKLAAAVVARSFKECMQNVVAHGFKKELVAASLAKAESKANTFTHKKVNQKLTVVIEVQSMQVEMVATGPLSEWELWFHSSVKAHSLGLDDGIPILPHEKLMLTEIPVASVKCKVLLWA